MEKYIADGLYTQSRAVLRGFFGRRHPQMPAAYTEKPEFPPWNKEMQTNA